MYNKNSSLTKDDFLLHSEWTTYKSSLLYLGQDHSGLAVLFSGHPKLLKKIILIYYSQNSSSVPAKGERMSSLSQI